MIVARAPSLQELEQFFSADPYQVKGIADYRFIEFDPLLRQGWMDDWIVG